MSLVTKEVATTCDPIFGIFTSSFLACSNSGDFKFHLESKNSTFRINFSVVVDEEDAEPPVVWPALFLPDRNVVIPAEHGEAIVSMFNMKNMGPGCGIQGSDDLWRQRSWRRRQILESGESR
ncbi:hypothetical protein BDR26DRAFT_1010550 [Obelidium mucronatum]|nr:hypothetical protein BDR26DRAFT_1017324 [Obelidium mucronatum]KAI9332552.1 hypothetical protein BDR26DRAFT_1010550 [Obelidium mucronatum]